MTTPAYLAARDINSRAESLAPMTIPSGTGNPVLDAYLFDLSRRFCGDHNPDTILNLLDTVMNAATSGSLEDHDLQIMAKSLEELYEADKMFHPYRNIRKITCFGSARTPQDDPSYQIAKEFGQKAASCGYMVITGGGPGIMQACNEGATEHFSFGLNITLPFEQHANPVVEGSDKMMNFYYFFTRKLNLLKQTDALVAFPGGFGTMDEIFETITLMQTGKSTLFPIVLLDPTGEMYWQRWIRFVVKELCADKLISPEDMSLIHVSKSAEEAMDHIERFYSCFHSYYFDDALITIRLVKPVSEEQLDWMRRDYADIMPQGDLQQFTEGDPTDPEPRLAELPRLRFVFKRGAFPRLRELIDVINDSE